MRSGVEVVKGVVVLRGTVTTLDCEVGTSVDETVVLSDTVGEETGVVVISTVDDDDVVLAITVGTTVGVEIGKLRLRDSVGRVESVVLAIDVGIITIEDEPVPSIGGSDKIGVKELEVDDAVGAVPGNVLVGKRLKLVGNRDRDRDGNNPPSELVLVPLETSVPDSVLDSVALADPEAETEVEADGRTALVTPPTALVTPPTKLVTPPSNPPLELVELWVTTPVGAIRIPEEEEGTVEVGTAVESLALSVAVLLVASPVVETSALVPVVVPVAEAVLLADTDVESATELGNNEGRSKLSVGKEISGGTPPVDPTLPEEPELELELEDPNKLDEPEVVDAT